MHSVGELQRPGVYAGRDDACAVCVGSILGTTPDTRRDSADARWGDE
jgi:hypothetical protein